MLPALLVFLELDIRTHFVESAQDWSPGHPVHNGNKVEVKNTDVSNKVKVRAELANLFTPAQGGQSYERMSGGAWEGPAGTHQMYTNNSASPRSLSQEPGGYWCSTRRSATEDAAPEIRIHKGDGDL